MAKSNMKVIEAAYCQVNNVLKKDVKKPEHQAIISTALAEVWGYTGLYPNETEKLKLKRLEMTTPADGEYSELSQHFKELYPEETTGLSAAAIIFMMYNRMKDLGEAKDTTDVHSTEEVSNTESSDTTNNSFYKEDNNMSNNHLTNLEDLDNELAGGVGESIQTTESMPQAKAPQAVLDAVAKQLEASKDDRLKFTQESIIEKLVLSSPVAVTRAVDGEKATGTIHNPEGVKNTLRQKLGVVENEDGTIKFTNVPETSLADARTIWNAVSEACLDEGKAFDVYFGKSNPSLKGVKVKVSGSESAEHIDMTKLLDILMKDAYYILNTTDPAVQAQVAKARTNQSAAATGTGTQRAKSNSNPYAGTTSVKIIGRTQAPETMLEYWKELTEETEVAGGMKSVLSVKYFRAQTDNNGVRKQTTYRLPLDVNQFKTAVSAEMAKAYGEPGSGVAAVAINVNDDKAMQALEAKITEVLANGIAAGKSGGIFDVLAGAAKDAEKAVAAEQAREFEGM